MMEYWNGGIMGETTGILDCWNIGMMGKVLEWWNDESEEC
jgi:hypothetical protein